MGGQINVLAATDVKVSAKDPESFILVYTGRYSCY